MIRAIYGVLRLGPALTLKVNNQLKLFRNFTQNLKFQHIVFAIVRSFIDKGI